jgi:hypothetical protein
MFYVRKSSINRFKEWIMARNNATKTNMYKRVFMRRISTRYSPSLQWQQFQLARKAINFRKVFIKE